MMSCYQVSTLPRYELLVKKNCAISENNVTIVKIIMVGNAIPGALKVPFRAKHHHHHPRIVNYREYHPGESFRETPVSFLLYNRADIVTFAIYKCV